MGLLAFGGLFEGADEIAITVSGAVWLVLCLVEVGGWFWPRLTELPGPVAIVLQLAGAVAVVAFCVPMARLSSELGLASLARSWAFVAVAVVSHYTLPQLLMTLFPALSWVVLIASTLLMLITAVVFLQTIHRSAGWRTTRSPRRGGGPGRCDEGLRR